MPSCRSLEDENVTHHPGRAETWHSGAVKLAETGEWICAGGMEAFGPGTANPYLAFCLEDAECAASWLAALPCPVIGIGDGALAPFCDVVLSNVAQLAEIARNIVATPIAAMVLVQHLRASEMLPPAHALTAESFAYATLQTGPEFAAWRRNAPILPPLQAENTAPLVIKRVNDALRLTFNRPASRNAISVELRDALCEAFDLALLDETIGTVLLDAAGGCFSIGGSVEDFGQVSDPATAHWIRSLRLPARRLVAMRDRLSVRVNGAAIGAGAEIAAFAGFLTATKNAWFQLPELKFGLIPGAGGTVSLPRRIGRQKTAYMALSMRRMRASTALAWGLVDAIED